MSFIDKIWYGPLSISARLLYPWSLVYQLITKIRRWYLLRFQCVECPVPLIVIGNITVGGVGKTPLVIELARRLTDKGIRVGIVSRGYGAQCRQFPYHVQLHDEASWVGDEPLLLAKKTQCPVVIAPHRTAAINYLIQHHQCQIILSDDGLQHYKMGRAIEIAVVDGTRGLGNGLCLPAGPLREPASRLNEVDFIVVNEGQWEGAYSMHCAPGKLTQVNSGVMINADSLLGINRAIAGIGNPQRFYSTLTQLGIKFIAHSYPDHYQFKQKDLKYDTNVIIMTEKDAIKCHSFSTDNMYFLPINAVVDDAFWSALWSHQQLQDFC